MFLKRIKIWFLATRAETLLISVSPITIGSVLAIKDHKFNIYISILTFLYGMFTHIGTNLSNDYFDYIKGADNEKRIAPFSTIQKKLTSLREIKFAYRLFFILAFIIGIIFIPSKGFLVFLLFILPILFGFFYTGGSKPLGYLGFGELLVFIFFGPFAVLGTYFLQTQKISYLPVIAGFGTGFLSVIILAINNLRDKEIDQSANKNTLSVKLGKKFTQIEIFACTFFAFLIPLICYFFLHNILILATSLILFFVPFKLIFKFKNPSLLNEGIQKIVILQIIYTILFCTGLF